MHSGKAQKIDQQEILVVDDTSINLRLLTKILTDHGYRVRPASSGRLALRSVAAKLPDLILLDVKMSEMDGYEVCRRLKSDGHSREVPVIFLSAFDETSEKIEAFNVGGVDYIPKPFESEEVLARVRTHLRLRELTERLEQKVRERTEELTTANRQLQQEIAERQRTEKALRESEERYRSLVENVDFGITLLDKNHRIIMSNSAQGNLFNKPSSSFVGLACFREFEKRDAVCSHCPGVKAMQTRRPHGVETEGVRDDGSRFPVYVNTFPTYAPDGTVTGFIEVVEDITVRKQAEKALKESEERWRLLVENLPAGSAVHSEGKIVFANKNCLKVAGATRKEEVLGRPLLDFVHPDYQDDVKERLEKILEYGRFAPPFEEKFRRIDGEIVDVEMTAIPLNYMGKPAVQTVFWDITAHKRAQEELKKHRDHLEELIKERTAQLIVAKELAESASRAKSQFLSNMSHELRTPLNTVMGYTQILKKQKNLTNIQKEQLNTVQSSGSHLLALINDLLDLSHIEAQKQEMEIRDFNLHNLIHEVLSTTRVKTIESALTLHYDELSSIPVTVRGDAKKLRKVLTNLLDNAVKNTKKGGITLRVSRRGGQSSTKQRTLRFEIEDTGFGIPEEKLKKIFEPFPHETVKGKTSEGIGLGLSISRRLVELMGGRLSVKSEVGKGSAFTVELELDVVEDPGKAALVSEKTIRGYKGERKRILIVDDNEENLILLSTLFESMGFDISTAENGREALEKAAAITPALILMDMLMPVMDGHEAVCRLKKDKRLRKIKVIGVSAAVAARERTEKFAADCDEFISKPLNIPVLLQKLKSQLGIEWIEEEETTPAAKEPLEPKTAAREKAAKTPPQKVLQEIIRTVEMGDFTGIERVLNRLMIDEAYIAFCTRIGEYVKIYDDEAIIDYIKKIKHPDFDTEEAGVSP